MATNHTDILDLALLRPGRIDGKIEFFLPSDEVGVGMKFVSGATTLLFFILLVLFLPGVVG